MDDIAARAGVGKAAIYRPMVVESGVDRRHSRPWRPDLLTNEAPDTGSLAGDLEAVVERVGRNDNDMVTSDLVLRVAIRGHPRPELATVSMS